ncbi:MAG: S1 RNA-binding domain-containing protein [Planctomycetota bacterium]
MTLSHPQRPTDETPTRGAHTLEVVDGKIVGIYGADVFVELGPRKQGVISIGAFPVQPAVGETHQFTLRGREDNLWILDLVHTRTLTEWEELEAGSLTSARVASKTHDGYQLKIGRLHAYMPYSESGVRKAKNRAALLGRSIVVEVVHVDEDKQRAIVSRKAVLRMQKEGGSPHSIVPGQVVQGRVSRIESYGVFLRLNRGREGLCHISNLSVERIDHPSEVVAIGDVLEARVLYVRAGGRRIGLGLKQLSESPWSRVEREYWAGQIVPVEVVRVGGFGAVTRLLPGVEGVLPISECGDPKMHASLSSGDRLSVRIIDLDPEDERIAFSLVHNSGRKIALDEAEALADFESTRTLPQVQDVLGESEADSEPRSGASTNVGDLLRRALEARSAPPSD